MEVNSILPVIPKVTVALYVIFRREVVLLHLDKMSALAKMGFHTVLLTADHLSGN